MTDDFDVDFDADDGEIGFAPAVSATGADRSSGSTSASIAPAKTARAVSRGGWRRRASGLMVLMVGLLAMGGLYGLFASSSNADNAASGQAQIDAGHQIFQTSCVTCHGANLQGVVNRGPSLIGVGAAATYFQVSTGRMPATGQSAEEYRKTSKFTEAETEALSAYVQSIGGGPTIPSGDLRVSSNQIADGGQLFRLNCASCHGSTGKGAPLSAGKSAPGLNDATDKQIVTAMLSGPESMPVFNDNQLTPDQKKEIVTYIQTLKASKDPGGNGIDRIGPVSEGIVVWILGVGALVLTIVWIGAKA
jgi:ubiquinol-cytochrome c reductase cytochrome c subunit